MTDKAFQKRRKKTHIFLADVHTKIAYGFYPSEVYKKIKEQEKIIKKIDDIIKEKDDKINNAIILTHFQEKKSIETIAEWTGLTIETNENIIANAKNS